MGKNANISKPKLNKKPFKVKRHNKNPISETKIKKKIRDVERLLKVETLKANVREENERAITALRHELEAAVKSNTEHKMARKYHMVRFIERKKATRRLRQAEGKLKDEPSEENEELVQSSKLDLYYTLHFPLTEKYIALYPQSSIESQEVLDKRKLIRERLREKMLREAEKATGSNAINTQDRKPRKRKGVSKNS